MQIESVAVTELHVDPANVRRHSDRNLASIKASLVRFGQQKPIVVSHKGTVIAGNGTLEAALSLGWERVNVVRSVLAGSEATAYSIADNRTAELAEWNDDGLAEMLRALQNEDAMLFAATGFDDKALAMLSPPTEFAEVDESIETEHQCPKCGYKWSGGE